MLVKLGVDISQLHRPIRRTLSVVDSIYKQLTGEEAVMTSTYEGDHGPSSLHYCHDAYDTRLPKQLESLGRLLGAIQNRLGSDFDVVGEADHIHIEYDPKF